MEVIHWYPGHMKKASHAMLEALKMVDVIVELVDARAPRSTQNPFFARLIANKPHILVYMKSDLADLKKTTIPDNAVLVSIKDKNSIKNLVNKIVSVSAKKREKEIKRGMKPLAIKAMIVGIPNIGKSSLINALINKKIAAVANKPGLTKNNRWINVNNQFYLLDTPGVLPTNYSENNYILALTGAIKSEILPIYELSEFAYNYIIKHYPDLYLARYKRIGKNSDESFQIITALRGYKNDKTINHEMARALFLKELRDGKIGKINFDA